MKKTTLLLFIAILILPSCGLAGGKSGTRVVKPKTYHRWYDSKKDRHKKRTRVVRMKS